MAQTLAAKKRQRINPDQELIGLGAANVASGMTGGYPVTGGFARSVVNFDAGAETPAAGAPADDTSDDTAGDTAGDTAAAPEATATDDTPETDAADAPADAAPDENQES